MWMDVLQVHLMNAAQLNLFPKRSTIKVVHLATQGHKGVSSCRRDAFGKKAFFFGSLDIMTILPK